MEEHATHVIIAGIACRYQDKAPFEASGVSIAGAIEYNPETDELRCHECGKWFSSLSKHITQKHPEFKNLTTYKEKHGLKATSSLISHGLRKMHKKRMKKLRKRYPQADKQMQEANLRRTRSDRENKTTARRLETRNERRRCREQVAFALVKLAEELGRTPSVRDLKQHGFPECTLRQTFDAANLGEIFRIVGLEPRPRGVHVSGRRVFGPPVEEDTTKEVT